MIFFIIFVCSIIKVNYSQNYSNYSNWDQISDKNQWILTKIDLENLINQTIITKQNALKIFEYLEKRQNIYPEKLIKPTEKSLEKNENSTKKINTEKRTNDSSLLLTIVVLIGFMIVLLLVSNFCINLYNSNYFIILAIILYLIGYNMVYLTQSLQNNLESHVLSGFIYNFVFICWAIFGHLILVIFKKQEKIFYIGWYFSEDLQLKSKKFMGIYWLFLGYILSFHSISPLSQIPFYLSIFYNIYLFGNSLIDKIPIFFQPAGKFIVYFLKIIINIF